MFMSSTSTCTLPSVGPRILINERYPGLVRVHNNPDIYVIEDFLDPKSCEDLMESAKEKKLDPSPVAYAGWTDDFKTLVELAAKGPVTWLAIGISWLQIKNDAGASQVDLIVHMLQNFGILLVAAVAAIAFFTKSRAESLQKLRTSTSTTVDDLNNTQGGAATFVRKAAMLFSCENDDGPLQKEASIFEAPTVIRYEAGQVLAPHYDANRSASVEDSNRGGQTLATLLVYLNEVEKGGLTRFGKLLPPTGSKELMKQCDESEKSLAIKPKQGDALLFFPADANGQFDERTEHEGMEAIDEKWIARIWRHSYRVPPPFGLSEEALKQI